MSDDFTYDVFLSHNSKDKPAVREVERLLSANGLVVWLDEDELRPGIPWQNLLEEGIRTSRSVAVLVGKDGLGPWEDEEMQGALRLAANDKRPVIPVLLSGAPKRPELPMFLGNRTWVDLRTGLTDDGLAKLIWGITGKKPERIEEVTRGHLPPGTEVVIAPTRLRHGAEHLVGRQKELRRLDRAWKGTAKRKANVVTIVAWGGVGKTSLVVEWMGRKAAAGWAGFERVLDWSFYSQGTREQGAASADTFIAKALAFFGDEGMAKGAASPWDKGARLAQLVAGRRSLLVLDGVEPLQYPPGPLAGQLKDPALEALLRGLAQQNPGLCVVTTREQVADLLPFRDTTAPEWELEHLSTPAGVELLKTLGVRGTEDEYRGLVKDVKGHALTLNIVGRFLVLAHKGDIRQRDLVEFREADDEVQGGHAFRVMEAYEKWFADSGEKGRCQLAILRLLGLFDRPADAGCLGALRKAPAIPGLTEPLLNLSEAQWNLTVSRLADCGLVSVGREPSAVDAHPLIREYFGGQLREKNREGWRSAHKRLYEHLKDSTEHWPDTLEDLQPLYQAVGHGCQAGMRQETCNEVYHDRIQRGREAYSIKKLGAVGADLGALAFFFEQPWGRVSPALSEANQAWLLNEAATRLLASGRLTESLDPMRAGMELAAKQEDLMNAAIGAGNLSELELTLGRVADAVGEGEQSVEFADRTGNAFERQANRVILADALHQAGCRDNALGRFREAETIQAERQVQYPLLYSGAGARHCDLLLAECERAAWNCGAGLQPVRDHGQDARATLDARDALIARCREVDGRAQKMFEWQTADDPLLDVALDHLTLGRATLYRAILTDSKTDHAEALETASQQLTAAVDGLRRAGVHDYTVRGLLSRAWLWFLEGDADGARRDLDEAWQMAERGPMRLFMADIHLYRARLFHAVKPYPWKSPKDDLAEARKLIEECGYHRRDEELADAEGGIQN